MVRNFCGMLDGLALLSVWDVAEGMQIVCANMPDVSGLAELVDDFDVTYVTGLARPVRRPHSGQRLFMPT